MPEIPPPPPERRPWLAPLLMVALLGVALAPWWRNHGLLRDPYDLSMLVTAVGKWQQGLRPFVDYDTPMQSGCVLANLAAERLFGPRFMSLAYGNALLITFFVVAGSLLLRRALGPVLAAVVATCCALLGASQHALIAHNPLGVFCMLLVTWACAAPPLRPGPRAAAYLAAGCGLVLGGMNKANFQAVTVSFAAGLLLVRALAGLDPWWRWLLGSVALMVGGLVLPVAVELQLSGATWRQWHHNVFELPSGRYELLEHLRDPKFYFGNIHEFYPGVHLRGPAAIAVGAGAVLGVLLGVAALRGPGPRRFMQAAGYLAGGIGAGFASAALVATNVEILFVPLGALVVLGWALVLAASPAVRPSWARGIAHGWLGLTVVLAGFGFVAAWEGGRIFYGFPKVKRADLTFRSADDLPPEFAYFRGTRLAPELHDAFRAVHAELAGKGPEDLRRVYFTYGMDWLERVWPESTARGLPLWLHEGTTYSKEDWAGLFARIVAGKQTHWLFTVPHWDLWPYELKISLEQSYRAQDLSHWTRVYRRLTFTGTDETGVLADPIPYLFLAQSNVMTRRTRSSEILYGLNMPSGRFVGNSTSTNWDLDFASYRFRGEAVASLVGRAQGEVPVEFRVVAKEPGRPDHVLWQDRVVLSADAPHGTRPFELDPGGRSMRLETVLPSGAPAVAGWMKLIITHSGPVDENPPIPILPDLLPASAEGVRLFTDAPPNHPVRVYGTRPQVDGDTITLAGPGEIWSTLPAPTARMTGRLEVPAIPGGAEKVYVRVNWYKSGRLEFFVEEHLEPGTAKNFLEFDRPMAEPEGWIGLMVVNPAKDGKPVAVRFRPFQRH